MKNITSKIYEFKIEQTLFVLMATISNLFLILYTLLYFHRAYFFSNL